MERMVEVESLEDGKIHSVDCFENTEPIEVGDYYLFFFGGMSDIAKCASENEKLEANDGMEYKGIGDLTSGFWMNCYKVKSADFDLSLVEY